METKQCPKCNNAVPADNRFCGKCGYDFNESGYTDADSSEIIAGIKNSAERSINTDALRQVFGDAADTRSTAQPADAPGTTTPKTEARASQAAEVQNDPHSGERNKRIVEARPTQDEEVDASQAANANTTADRQQETRRGPQEPVTETVGDRVKTDRRQTGSESQTRVVITCKKCGFVFPDGYTDEKTVFCANCGSKELEKVKSEE